MLLKPTLNLSLSHPTKECGETSSKAGRYLNAADYVGELIGKDQMRRDKTTAIQQFVDDGLLAVHWPRDSFSLI